MFWLCVVWSLSDYSRESNQLIMVVPLIFLYFYKKSWENPNVRIRNFPCVVYAFKNI